jgi:Tfp pilus assembly protein PilN
MSINLLPPQLKREQKIEFRMKQFFARGIKILVLIFILAALIYGGNRSIQAKAQDMVDKINQVNDQITAHSGTEQKINLINSKLQKINTADSNRVLWNAILNELAKSTPKQVVIKGLSLDQSSKTITLTGEAETRQDIAAFKEKLEVSSYFKNVFFSSSSINENNKNFTFSISAEIEKNR